MYVNVDGAWTAGSGKPKAELTALRKDDITDIGPKCKVHKTAPAWADDVPDHWA